VLYGEVRSAIWRGEEWYGWLRNDRMSWWWGVRIGCGGDGDVMRGLSGSSGEYKRATWRKVE